YASIRVMFGPQDDLFTAEAQDTLISAPYMITNESDRMGYRMKGSKLSHKLKADILSDGIAPGSIQVPGHGQPIIMLADRQSIGGYAKIATVIGADLPILGQMKPGQSVTFAAVSREEALLALSRQNAVRDRELCGPYPRRHFAVRVGHDVFRVDMQEILGG
ncbi:MAG TPA: KipI antagonist, partial [Bacillota bacterium]|nr:KipI antagonist [Bacillota bacterium]